MVAVDWIEQYQARIRQRIALVNEKHDSGGNTLYFTLPGNLFSLSQHLYYTSLHCLVCLPFSLVYSGFRRLVKAGENSQ